MANKMLIDATHPEETRVVVVRGNRVEEFDYESATREQLRGNIYLARVTRVEPSLQAAFVDYGGNRHGFLAFSEIHPDYYQIPVADREALLEEEAESARRDADADNDDSNGKSGPRRRRSRRGKAKTRSQASESVSEEVEDTEPADAGVDRGGDTEATVEGQSAGGASVSEDVAAAVDEPNGDDAGNTEAPGAAEPESASAAATSDRSEGVEQPHSNASGERSREDATDDDESNGDDVSEDDDDVESVGSEDALEEVPERRARSRRSYKIQEVIKRRQVMLVQVVKEERGNKGAALTTYLSLAGRYCVLMPNTARGGGISRKITNASDRKRLKDVAKSLEVPQGMGLILRTAGASRTKAEVKRDYEYLLRLWESVRERTLSSIAPTLVYEEGSLVKRAIRDLYNKEIDEVLVSGDEAYREGKDFMRMLMPSHAKNVQPYKDETPIFTRFAVEGQLDAMFNPQVTLKSGGYIVINQTEALVSIDVNSGKSTREHSIEDTALRTNLEAAEEVARQLRLRDLAGLIVIDFIDMDENRNNRAVERKIKDCLKTDRARIQIGRISHFGLLEMSRQRLRPGLLEGSMQVCEHCQGTGLVRSTESVALHVIRTLEEELMRRPADLAAKTATAAALYILNNKRDHLIALESRFGVSIAVDADDALGGVPCLVERGDPRKVKPRVAELPVTPTSEDMGDDDADDGVEEQQPEKSEESSGRKRRRRRGRRSGTERSESEVQQDQAEAADSEDEGDAERSDVTDADGEEENGNGKSRRRRRGRRGGRRRSERSTSAEDGQENGSAEAASDSPSAGNAEEAGPDQSTGDPEMPHADAPSIAVDDQGVAADDETPSPASETPDDVNADPGGSDTPTPDLVDAGVAVAVPEGPTETPASQEPAQPLEDEAPAGPPRKGWWQRRILGG